MGSWFNSTLLTDSYSATVTSESINKCVDRKSTSYPADECAILKKKSLSANKILREKLADMSTPHEDNGAYLRASYHTAVS